MKPCRHFRTVAHKTARVSILLLSGRIKTKTQGIFLFKHTHQTLSRSCKPPDWYKISTAILKTLLTAVFDIVLGAFGTTARRGVPRRAGVPKAPTTFSIRFVNYCVAETVHNIFASI